MTRRDPYRHYQRHARRYRRHGGYPVIMLGTGEPVTIIAMAAAGRWAYRHRSAFLPFAITAALSIVAALTHHHHARREQAA